MVSHVPFMSATLWYRFAAVRCAGDSRLGSMETGTGLMRALRAVLDNGCDIVNMSYGEYSAEPETAGRFAALAQTLVQVGVPMRYLCRWVSHALVMQVGVAVGCAFYSGCSYKWRVGGCQCHIPACLCPFVLCPAAASVSCPS